MTAQKESDAAQLALALAEFIERYRRIKLGRASEDAGCLRIANHLIKIVKRTAEKKSKSPAGRKPTHDRQWCRSALLDIMTRDPDGLPPVQASMVEMLRLRLEHDGRPMPGDTWLKKIVSEFYAEARLFEEDAIEKFKRSKALHRTFDGDFSKFLAFRRSRLGMDEEWRRSPEMQKKYPTKEAYIDHILSGGSLEDH
ncbi:hypothetical protein [Aestuariivirga sp.]|uniref:hypothetical protein n=1 Tax=Aestuariivirga sp. TaxID=2650926 RepID=UPI0039E5543A